MRQFAQERLRAVGDEPAIRERHFGYYLALAERVEPALEGGPEQKQALDLLEADHDNLRSALTWALEIPERAESAIRMCSKSYALWIYRGYWEERYAWCMKALEQAPTGGDKSARAKTLLAAGSLLDKRPLLEEALRLSREARDRHTEALALNNLARLLRVSGVEVSRAQTLLEESRMISRELGNPAWELASVANLVACCRLRSDPAAALVLAEDGLSRSRSLKDRALEAGFLANLAALARDRSDIAPAQAFYEQSLRVYREAGRPLWEANNLSELAALAVMRGDASSASSHLTEALGIYRKIGERGLELAPSFDVIGALASQAHQDAEAARFSGVADTLRGSVLPSDPFHRERVLAYRAQNREALGDAAYDAANEAGLVLKREAAIDEAIAWLASLALRDVA